jgi:hypothetical protein
MSVEQLEARVQILEEQNKVLQNQIRTLQDIEEIKILQRCYGYYYEKLMGQEFLDLFADGPDTALHMLGSAVDISFVGKEALKDSIEKLMPNENFPNPESLHSIVMCSGVIHVNPDGKTALGRWYGIGEVALPRGKGIEENRSLFIYENKYVKEDGRWKFKVVKVYLVYSIDDPVDSIIKPDRHWKLVDPESKKYLPEETKVQSRVEIIDSRYPSGYITPFHFTHPITGNKTSEEKRNTILKRMKEEKNK